MSDYYDSAAVPATKSFGSSAVIRDEFQKIEDAFGKLPVLAGSNGRFARVNDGGTAIIASTTLFEAAGSVVISGGRVTGTGFAAGLAEPPPIGTTTPNAGVFTTLHATAPIDVNDASTRVATTDFVAQRTFTTNLPSQTGNAGKFLQTDGSNASWQLALPAQGGNAGRFLTTDGTAPSWASPLGYGGQQKTTPTTLTSSDVGAIALVAPGLGTRVVLPNATTISSTGAVVFGLENKSGFPIGVFSNDTVCLGFLGPYSSAVIGLVDNTTEGGVWTQSGLRPYGLEVSSVLDLPTALDNGATSIRVAEIDAERTVIVLSNDSGVYATVYSDSTRTFGPLTAVRTTNAGSFTRVVALDSSRVLVVNARSSSNPLFAVVLSVSGTDITVNTANTVTLATNFSGMGADDRPNLVFIQDHYVIAYTRSASDTCMRAMTVSGTTVTIGSETSNTYFGTAIYPIDENIGATIGVSRVCTFSVSNNTISVGANALLNASVVRLSEKRLFCLAGGTTATGSVVSFSGITPSVSSVTLSTHSSTAGVTGGLVAPSTMVCLAGGNSNSAQLKTNVLTHNNGTAVAGTELTLASSSATSSTPVSLGVSGGVFRAVRSVQNSPYEYWAIAAVAGSPVLVGSVAGLPSNIVTPISNSTPGSDDIFFGPFVGRSGSYTSSISSGSVAGQVFTGGSVLPLWTDFLLESGINQYFSIGKPGSDSAWSVAYASSGSLTVRLNRGRVV